jgi:hypothetical protein
MPFLLYRHWPKDSDSLVFRRVREVSVGGKHGPIAKHVANECGDEPGCGWHMSETQLLDQLSDTPGHAVLIDLKPTTTGNVSLYRLTDVWGFSYREWTPVCLRLESLFIDEHRANAEEFKEEFPFRPEDGGVIAHEFLYLNGGTSEGTWNWGMAGSVNGALLFQDAWEYLANQVRYE